MQKADILIRSKLRQPFTRRELVPRPRLQARIREGLGRPLTLLAAPAGFGKTTLIASCAQECDLAVAWLSLDRDDNEEGRFLNYLVAALQQADRSIGREAAQRLAATQQPSPETVLTCLINDLDAASREIALVLDDYQFIHSQAVHEMVTFLLDYCPKTLHLVIASRSDPRLPLTRFRARDQLVELRAAELRFTESEATRFLNDVMDLGLDAGSIAVLETRTEGWIAGLQMAALALQGTPSLQDHRDVPHFIAEFSGTNRYIMDYLLEEVLASQSSEIQRFLLHTSILERLAAPLCDAVLGAQETRESAQSKLEYLERANLFLVPLDDERTWYRYHHLFADLLRARLQRSLEAQDIAQLHVRASEWHQQNGSLLAAIHHASEAADEARVECLIEQHYLEMVNRGEMASMRSWANNLRKELVYRRPWLCIYEAHSHAWFGELDQADRLLKKAEKRIPSEISAPDAPSMRGHLAYVKSRVTAMRGDLPRAIEFCLAAREHVSASNPALQSDISITLGYEYFCAGDYVNSSQVLEETIRSGMALEAVTNTVAAYYVMAKMVAIQGLLHRSYNTCQRAAQLIPKASGEHLGPKAVVQVGMADVLREWNHLEKALAHTEQGLALMPWWGKADDLALAYVILARIHLAQGNGRDAEKAIENARQVLQTSGVFSEARSAVEAAQVRLWLAKGDMPAAARWAAVQERSSAADPLAFGNELANISRARVWIAQNKPRQAAALLSDLAAVAYSAGRMGRVIEILALQALALRAGGDVDQAFWALTEGLTLAQPQGYVRVFVDEGQPMHLLLAQWLAQANAGLLPDYARRLLSHFDAEPQAKSAAEQALVEPLSPRELEVLHLLALGKTNKQIAHQLVVALGTVKAHTASIYRKLDVANRTEAAARARQLGILSLPPN
jgi:LuxR family maltose regulon positive regulatory protein